MKPFLTSLLARFARSTTRIATFYRVIRTDTQAFGWVQHTSALTIDGITYTPVGGLLFTAADMTDDFAVGSVDVSVFMDVSTEAEIRAGIWDEAAVTIFEADWSSPPAVIDDTTVHVMQDGLLGKIERQNLTMKAEIRSKKARFETRIGSVTSPSCRWIFGDAFCGFDTATVTVSGTVSSVGVQPRLTFSAAALTERNGYFNEGVITFTSGDNDGRGMDIRLWNNNTFTMHRPLPYAPQVGDTFEAIQGCDRTWATCKRFANQERFGGEPLIPGIDKVHENPLLKRPKEPLPVPTRGDGNPLYDVTEVGTDQAEGGSASGDAGGGGSLGDGADL